MADAASVNVQLARASRPVGTADTSAPALRRREALMATILLMVNIMSDYRSESIGEGVINERLVEYYKEALTRGSYSSPHRKYRHIRRDCRCMESSGYAELVALG